MPEKLIIAGDIGGTKTNLGLFAKGERRPELKRFESYPSAEAKGLEELVARFLDAHPAEPKAACFGVAGPVTRGVCKATNLPWVVSERNLKDRFGWEKVSLINDLTATALAIPALDPSEVAEINAGEPGSAGAQGLVAPGTGLGMALIVAAGDDFIPIPSEGGHVDFSPTNEAQMELLRSLSSRMGRVSVERLGSGPGLHAIYSWLKESRQHTEPQWLKDRMAREDPSMVISTVALERGDSLCVEALDMFVSIIGTAAGNLALTGMTLGGVWLGGGIPPDILPKLRERVFMDAFTAKGRFKGLMEAMPVKVILNDKAALLGAARGAWRSLG